MRRSAILTAFVIAHSPLATESQGSEAASKAGPVKICLEDYMPFSGLGPDGHTIMGFTPKILSSVFKQMGLEIKLAILPWLRCIDLVKEGTYDAAANVGESRRKTKTKDGLCVGRTPLSPWALAVWVRDDSPFREYRSLEQFKGLRVGVTRGYPYANGVGEYPGWTKDFARTTELALVKLDRGRTDIAIADMLFDLPKDEPLKIRPLKPAIYSDTLFLGFNAGKKDLAVRFDAELAKFIASGAMDRIFEAEVGVKYTDFQKDMIFAPLDESTLVPCP